MIINKDNNKNSKILHGIIKNNIFLVTDIKNDWKILNKRKNNLIIKIFDIILLAFLFYFFSSNNFWKLIHKSKYIKYLEKKFDNRFIAFNKAIHFITNCISPNLFQFQSNNLFEDPKISVVMPMYNCEKFILRAVKSIQYQNISNIEIILVDDKSTDNTLFLAEKMQKEDKRIRLIKNQNNKGILYSKSIGVLSSKGKYLYTLDNDDMFLDDDIFHTITSIGENGHFDIVEFRAISNKILNQNILNNIIEDAIFTHYQPFILFQPELGRYPIQTGNKTGSYYLVDIFLWGKCIRTSVYQKALNKLGFIRYSRYMIRYEDILANYMIFNTAESFICVLKYGIYHINRKGSAASIGLRKVSRTTNILYLIDVVIDFSQDNSINKKLASHLLIYFLKLRRVKRNLTSNKYNFNIINSCLKRVLNSPKVSDNYKIVIRNLAKRIGLKQ